MKYYLTIIVILIITGCSKTYYERVSYEKIGIDCLSKENTGYIITSKEQFDLIASEIYENSYGPYCNNPPQAPFSFDDYVLIGRHTKFDTNDKVYLDVYVDKNRNKSIYKIELDKEPGPVNNGSFGNIYGESMNWVKVPKPPLDQAIVIEYRVL